MSLKNLSSKVPCARCFKGVMVFKKHRSDNHVFFQCSTCRKIDELALVDLPDGAQSITLVVKEWGEVLDEAVEGLISQLQNSAKELSEWRDKNQESLSNLQRVISGWKELQHVLYFFQTESPTDPRIKTPWQFTIVEADRELTASRTFAALGFYKDALRSLRSYIELTLFGIYIFGTQDEGYFRDWLQGQRKILSFTGREGIVANLIENTILKQVDSLTGWADEIVNHYALLSRFVHTRGKEFSNLWLWQKSQPFFNIEAWDKWIDIVVKTIELVSVPIISYFPRSLLPVEYFEKFAFDGPVGLYLDDEQVEVVRALFLSSKYINALEQTINDITELKNEIAEVKQLPDLTEEEIQETLKKFLKSMTNAPVFEKERVKKILEDERFKRNPTVQWSMLLNYQRKYFRDASLVIIARELELLRSEGE